MLVRTVGLSESISKLLGKYKFIMFYSKSSNLIGSLTSICLLLYMSKCIKA